MNRHTAGFTLIEVLFALTLLIVVSTGLARSLAQAWRARAASRDLVRATQLAADAIELWRAGADDTSLPESEGKFVRRIDVVPVAPDLKLNRIDVTVSWNDGKPQQVTLRTLLP